MTQNRMHFVRPHGAVFARLAAVGYFLCRMLAKVCKRPPIIYLLSQGDVFHSYLYTLILNGQNSRGYQGQQDPQQVIIPTPFQIT